MLYVNTPLEFQILECFGLWFFKVGCSTYNNTDLTRLLYIKDLAEGLLQKGRLLNSALASLVLTHISNYMTNISITSGLSCSGPEASSLFLILRHPVAQAENPRHGHVFIPLLFTFKFRLHTRAIYNTLLSDTAPCMADRSCCW